MDEKIIVATLSKNGEGELISDIAEIKEVFIPEIGAAEIGDVFTIEIKEMDKKEYLDLPEFDGF